MPDFSRFTTGATHGDGSSSAFRGGNVEDVFRGAAAAAAAAEEDFHDAFLSPGVRDFPPHPLRFFFWLTRVQLPMLWNVC